MLVTILAIVVLSKWLVPKQKKRSFWQRIKGLFQPKNKPAYILEYGLFWLIFLGILIAGLWVAWYMFGLVMGYTSFSEFIGFVIFLAVALLSYILFLYFE